MARRMYSIDQINSEKPTSLSLYQHNINIFSFDSTMNAYMTVYSVNSSPATTKQELVDNLLTTVVSATGTAETNTKLIFAINAQGELLYTDMAGNQLMYSDDYNVLDEVVAIGG